MEEGRRQEEEEWKRSRKARGGGRQEEEEGTREGTEKGWENNFQISIPPSPHPILLTNIVEQFPSRHVLHDHEYVGGCGDDLVQLDDVWVAKQLQNLDLPTDLLNHIQTTGRRAISSVYMYHRYESSGCDTLGVHGTSGDHYE